MGVLWSTFCRPDEVFRLVYVKDQSGRFFPVRRPETFSAMLLMLQLTFDFMPADGVLECDDATRRVMHVCSEETYQALVPVTLRLDTDTTVSYVTVNL